MSLASGAVVHGLGHVTRGAFGDWSDAEQGHLVGQVEFAGEGTAQMDSAFGDELDGRLFTSLSGMNEKELVTPEERFYVRTRASKLLLPEAGWKITIGGMVEGGSKERDSEASRQDAPADSGVKPLLQQARHQGAMTIAELRATAKPLGLHLLECAGNTRAAHFGMISVGEWAGVPLGDVLGKVRPAKAATRVLVSGFDRYAERSVTSTPGASWIFTFEDLKIATAFLATELNGKPLSKDHGAPVRLVVPGWYGCTCIKWVNEITLVDDAAEATSQMQEYAGRTHQNGVPRLAKDFLPARIEHAAMPIRVEQWADGGKVFYRVVGILWGGSRQVERLGIRFNPEEEYVPVEHLPVPQTSPWTLWSHTWRPSERGTYTIRLAVLEPELHPKRLESGYYARSVVIEEI